MVRSIKKKTRRQRRGAVRHWKQTDSWYFTPRGTKRRVALRLRPFCESAKLRAENIEESPRGMLRRIRSSTTKTIRKIPVRPEVAKLIRKLLESAPAGSDLPVFRNPQGRPWKKVTGVHRFLAAKRRLGWDQDSTRKSYTCYSCRHTFAYRMLSGYRKQMISKILTRDPRRSANEDKTAILEAHQGVEYILYRLRGEDGEQMKEFLQKHKMMPQLTALAEAADPAEGQAGGILQSKVRFIQSNFDVK